MKNGYVLREKYNDFDSGMIYLLAISIPVLVGLILSFILDAIAISIGYAGFIEVGYLTAIYYAVVTLSLLGMFFVYNKVTKTKMRKAGLINFKFGWLNLAICVVISIVMLFGFNSFINLLMWLMEFAGYKPDTSLPLPLNSPAWLVVNIVVLALLPAICEEVIYRGVLLNGLRRFGNVTAILLSGLLFALAHGSAMQFFYQFILGVVLAYIVVKTGSLILGMVVHFLNNATVLIVNYAYNKTGAATELSFTTPEIIYAIVFALAAVAVLILLIWFLKDKNKEKIYEQERQKKFSTPQSKMIFIVSCVLAVGMWVIGTFWA